MNLIISYDISDEKRLRKIAKYLEKVSLRVQYSVFLFPNPKREHLQKVIRDLVKMIGEEDSIKVYKFSMKYTISNYEIEKFIV